MGCIFYRLVRWCKQFLFALFLWFLHQNQHFKAKLHTFHIFLTKHGISVNIHSILCCTVLCSFVHQFTVLRMLWTSWVLTVYQVSVALKQSLWPDVASRCRFWCGSMLNTACCWGSIGNSTLVRQWLFGSGGVGLTQEREWENVDCGAVAGSVLWSGLVCLARRVKQSTQHRLEKLQQLFSVSKDILSFSQITRQINSWSRDNGIKKK